MSENKEGAWGMASRTEHYHTEHGRPSPVVPGLMRESWPAVVMPGKSISMLPNADDPHRPNAERRRRRTENPLLALSWLLERARQSAELQTLVLADDSGLLIAGAGGHYACEALAAAVAVQPGLPANDTVPCRLDVLDAEARVRRVRIDGVELLLAAQGERGAAPSLDAAAQGAERILGSRPRSYNSAASTQRSAGWTP